MLSFSGFRILAVILSRLHLEDVGNDAVNSDVTYQAGEEKLLCDAGVHEAQGRETSQDTGQPEETNTQQVQQSNVHQRQQCGTFRESPLLQWY